MLPGMIQQAIGRLVEREDLTREETSAVMEEIMTGQATDSQISGFLVALRMKGETSAEITGCASVMRSKAARVPTSRTDTLDTCGTGGDRTGTFNISTGAAIVAAASGVPVAKHGNRAVSSRSGSADVLLALGVELNLSPEAAGRVLDEVGITFLYAPMMHQAMKYAMGVRKDLALRTVFNILGPLTNPAGAPFQVLGVYAERLTRLLAEVLGQLGSTHALVVHGSGGLDELSTVGPTTIAELSDGNVRLWSITPEESGLRRTNIEALRGGQALDNAGILRSILAGTKGPQRDIVVLNAGAGIYASGKARSVSDGVRRAESAIDSGDAARLLDRWIEASKAARS